MSKPPRLPARKLRFFPAHSQRSFSAWCEVIEYRPPKRGEYYLSGAIVEAYMAPEDMSSSYWVCEPLFPNDNRHVMPKEKNHGYA